MEIIIYFIITILMWVLSTTIFLPLLILFKFSKTVRDRWFSYMSVKMAPVFGALVEKLRKSTFELLDKHLEGRNKNTPLEILEIGIGDGANLAFYPENSNLTVVDMNESFMQYLEVNLKKHSQVVHKRTVIAMAEDMHEVPDNSFDVVVSTYVLCSVTDVRSVLKEVKRVLKPGGKFLFLEHIIYPGVSWMTALQWLASPIWKIVMDGCNLKRRTDEELRKAGFSDVVIERHYIKEFWLYLRAQIIGIATK